MLVNLGTATGITRDVGQSSLYIETDAQFVVGSKINPHVEIDTSGGRMILKCHGNVVRVERRDTKTGVAVKIIESTMEPIGQT